MGWTPEQLPDLSGHTYAITGGNGGLGLEASKILAGKGARVLITSRSEDKAKGAIAAIKQAVPGAEVDYVLLDLSEPESVKAAADQLVNSCPMLNAIINNAGVMQTPEVRTSEGFELQFATNHLGHFRLNSAMFPHIDSCGARIVVVSSIAHKFGTIKLNDLNSNQSYNKTDAYGQSKLANLMYSFELQRRLAERGSAATCYAAHPGYSATNLQTAGVSMDGGSALYRWVYKVSNALLAQSATLGAYPLILAAADPTAKPGAYYGPTGIMQARGPVGQATVDERARDTTVASALWDKTEDLVGPFFG